MAGARVIVLAAAVGVAGLTVGCDDRTQFDIKDEINIVIRRDDALVPPALQRLAAYGRLAVPQIETALHTAAPAGRRNLLRAFEMIGDEEAVPVLRHVAVFDVTPEVRKAAEDLLQRWAAGSDARAVRARAALARVTDKRAQGQGPVHFGDGGTPGAPATVGAPGMVGPGTGDKAGDVK